MSARKPPCKHDGIIGVNRRVFGWEFWTFQVGQKLPFELGDDYKVYRSIPKTGICDDCHRRVNIPYHLSADSQEGGGA